MNPRQAFNLKNEIPSNYTTYQVRAYYMCTVERGYEPSVWGPYATNSFIEDADENWQWTDYAEARAVFIDALKISDYYRIELVATTADEDDDSPHIVVEEWARQKKVKAVQDDFTNRMCENPACNKEFDLSDPHYYDEEQSVCYCCEECYKNNV